MNVGIYRDLLITGTCCAVSRIFDTLVQMLIGKAEVFNLS